jgi:hypothetical protein
VVKQHLYSLQKYQTLLFLALNLFSSDGQFLIAPLLIHEQCFKSIKMSKRLYYFRWHTSRCNNSFTGERHHLWFNVRVV